MSILLEQLITNSVYGLALSVTLLIGIIRLEVQLARNETH